MKNLIYITLLALFACNNFSKPISGKYYLNIDTSKEEEKKTGKACNLSIAFLTLWNEIEFRDDGKVIAMGGVSAFDYERKGDFIYVKTNDGFQISMKIINSNTLKVEDGNFCFTTQRPKEDN